MAYGDIGTDHHDWWNQFYSSNQGASLFCRVVVEKPDDDEPEERSY